MPRTDLTVDLVTCKKEAGGGGNWKLFYAS
jgi:hypothetical protein